MKEWVEALKEYEVLLGEPEKEEVKRISYDSRKAEKGDLFLCMRGSKMDSHDKIPELLEKGIRVFVVEKELEELPLEGKNTAKLSIVKVENARAALAELSACYFHYPAKEMLMIGITGTKGKTTTASMVRSILEGRISHGAYRNYRNRLRRNS